MKILRDYQMGAVRYLRKHNGGALFISMRLGKTLCTVRYLQMKRDVKRIIIIAPYSTFNSWLNENPAINKIDINSLRIDYSTMPGWFIINKEAHLRTHFLQFQWDAVIIDESFIQNPKAKITKYILRFTRNIPIRILLTGTPAPESQLQYYTQLAFLFPGVFGVKNFWEYRARYARPFIYEWRLTPQGLIKLEKVLREKCFVLTCKDVRLYPQPVYEKRIIHLSDMSTYKKAERDCLDSEDNILKFSGQRWNHCRRLCSGKEKEKELSELLNGELAGKQIIIWAFYIEEINKLRLLLRAPAIYGDVDVNARNKIVSSFNEGMIKYLIIQPETMKFGADLSAADTAIYFSSPVGLLSRQQSEARIINTTRKYPVLIIDLIAQNTVEEDIIESLHKKENSQKLLERVKNGIYGRND